MRYTRHRYGRSSFYGYFPPGVKWLLIVNTAVFILASIAPNWLGQSFYLLSLVPYQIVHRLFVWQLVTYMFLHGGVWHLLFNMLTLWMFGVQLEQDWGTRRFLKYYFICGIGAGLFDVGLHAMLGDWGTRTIGASGAIMGLLLAFGVLYPNQTVLMNFLFPIKAKYMVMIYGAIELWMSFQPDNGIASIAHLGGMAVGYVYLKGRLPKFNMPDVGGAYRQWKLQRARKKFQVYMRKHGDRGPWIN